MSDFDKNALEEATRIKEKVSGVEVVTLTVTSEDVKPVLREALAMGADKAFVANDASFKDVDTLGTAYALSEAIRKIGEFDLILCGESSLDSFSGLVGARLGELLSLPEITAVRKLTVEGEMVMAERALEDSIESVRAKLPVLVTVTREINQPRIPSLMMIMKASKKEIVTWTSADLGLQKDKLISKIEIIEVVAPKTERKKIRITGESMEEIADKLARALIQEGVVVKR
jgi:electron transfer flavoprotein beta subunit